METPKQYAQRKVNEMTKGNARIWITNMKLSSHLQSDKDFYSKALKELDNVKQTVTIYHKDATVSLPDGYEGVDG